MLNLGQITATVQKNCHISDAQFAGDYTLCVFLLKMREFYRWENHLPYSGALSREAVGQWMQERERMWESLEDSSFESLPMSGETVDPFESASINQALIPQGYVYSAGYGRFGKPHFFLGRLQEQRRHDNVTVYISSCEYARDLVAPPAMTLDNVVYLRQESLRRVLWERVEEWQMHRKNEAMRQALEGYGFDDELEPALDRMTAVETESVILHELGEAQAEMLLGPAWPQMLGVLARTKAELYARAVRDLLADCLVTLPGLLERGHQAALHFYFASLTDLRRHLFPEAMTAYAHWLQGDRQAIARLAENGRTRWLETAKSLLDLYHQHGTSTAAHIDLLFEPPPACSMPAAH